MKITANMDEPVRVARDADELEREVAAAIYKRFLGWAAPDPRLPAKVAAEVAVPLVADYYRRIVEVLGEIVAASEECMYDDQDVCVHHGHDSPCPFARARFLLGGQALDGSRAE